MYIYIQFCPFIRNSSSFVEKNCCLTSQNRKFRERERERELEFIANLPGTEYRGTFFLDRIGSHLKIEERTGSHYEISQVSQISHVPAIFCDTGPGSHGTGTESIALNFLDRKVPRYFFFGTVPMPGAEFIPK